MATQQDTSFVSSGQLPSEFLITPAPRTGAKEMSAVAPYLAEFIGTFLLVFTVAYVSFFHTSIFGGTAIGVALMVLVYSLGPVSGGHLNPAVSITLCLAGKFAGENKKLLPAYILCQCAGGLLAGGAVRLMFAETLPFGPHEYYHGWQAGVVEVAYTFMLCFVVANCAASFGNKPEDDSNCFFGLAIGFVVIAGAYGGGNISGGCFNPAVALGMDLPFACNYWAAFYCLEEVGGACLAVLCFKVCRYQEKSKDLIEDPSLGTQALSEFLGAFMLVFTVGLNLSTYSDAGAWSIAAALMCMIYALGDVSGGHFNPAVTLAVHLAGKDEYSLTEPAYARRKATVYILMQVLGGVLAGIMYESIHCSLSARDPHFKPIVVAPGTMYTWPQAAIAESSFTSILAFVVLSVAVYVPKEEKKEEQGAEVTPSRVEKSPWITKHKNHAPLAIGLCIVLGGNAIGNVSGGHLNPAVSIGAATGQHAMCGDVDGHFLHTTPLRWSNCLLYSLFQLGGGAFAAGAYFATHPDDYKF